jgi:hypothetical protein
MVVCKVKDGRKIKGYVSYDSTADYPYFSAVGKPSDNMVVGGSYKTFDEAIHKCMEATGIRSFSIVKGFSCGLIGNKYFIKSC